MVVFQLTTSRRGRQESNRTGQESGTKFQLTTSRRGRRCPRIFHKWRGRYFNSRPHEEVDVRLYRIIIFIRYFNSRPHEEVDNNTASNCLNIIISTHDLTKRSTRFNNFVYQCRDISTHDLTKRSTNITSSSQSLIGISTHDLTKRSTALRLVTATAFTFQLTTSRRGRPIFPDWKNESFRISTHDLTKRSTYFWVHVVYLWNISTHDLTKRSTIIRCFLTIVRIFQLTTSRRGRPR